MRRERNANKKKPLWVLGALGAFFLTKIKTILPLMKLGTVGGAVISMMVSVGAYALIAPLQLAIGFVLLILIHELGHVFAARQKGLPTSAPVFIPLIGAIVNMKRHPRDAETEAYIAMGGPVLGSIGALIALLIGWQWDIPLFMALAYIGVLLNLLNLLPIQPLDGGKIAIAVSRWLWLLGLVVGIVVIVWLKLYFLFVLWAWFAWDLYRKYIASRTGKKGHSTWASFEIPASQIEERGGFLPGTDHRRDLEFTTFSELNGKQKVVLYWDQIGFRGLVPLAEQGLITQAFVHRVDRRKKEGKLMLVIRVQVDYDSYENDAYYEVPVASRWKFGCAYALLACLLLILMYVVADIGMPLTRR